jgi:ribosomal protein S21
LFAITVPAYTVYTDTLTFHPTHRHRARGKKAEEKKRKKKEKKKKKKKLLHRHLQRLP